MVQFRHLHFLKRTMYLLSLMPERSKERSLSFSELYLSCCLLLHPMLKITQEALNTASLYFDFASRSLQTVRGVQYMYVHWVMHKCIMVKVGRKKKCVKYFKKIEYFAQNRGGKFVKGGIIIIFSKKGGNFLKQAK